MQRVIEMTDDGSSTIFLPEIDEHYHSIKGALTEAQHIYRDCAFMYRSSNQPLRLLEVGFGTGLNATVTAMASSMQHQVHYITLEKYPVEIDIIKSLRYGELLDSNLFDAIHSARWNELVEITPFFTLEKRLCDYTVDELPQKIDVVYFDAFAPEKQPDMWTRDAFSRLVAAMNVGGVLTTYCAKGEVRRLLQSLGLVVERIPGPLNGKREILRATKPA